MIANIYWLVAIPAAELGDVRDRNVIKAPKKVFIECSRALLEAYLNAVCEIIILPDQVLFLHPLEEIRITTFCYKHMKKPGCAGLLFKLVTDANAF